MVRHKRKGRAATNKKIEHSKSASAQQAQILDLNKKVNLNARKLEGLRYKVTHSTRLALPITGTVGQPYRAIFCNNLSDMNLQFSAPEEATGGKYNFDGRGRFHLEFSIGSNTEPTPMPLSVFLVSPKNTKVSLSIGMSVPGTAFNLIAGTDYVNNLGITHMNSKRWIIHKHWSNINILPIQTMQTGPAAVWQGDMEAIRKKFSMPNRLKINNRRGTWNDPAAGSTNESVNPSQRVVMVVFNNNISSPMTFPNLTGQVIHTAYTSE